MKTILFVEDDPIIIKVYCEPLKRAGYQVEVAEDGLVAMRVLAQSCPDLVLLDIMMPRVEGTYVLKFIRSRAELAGTKVIVLSNASIMDAGSKVLEQNPDRVFLKSHCTPKELLAAASELLAG
jgi:CheY-like chemotaxis protein